MRQAVVTPQLLRRSNLPDIHKDACMHFLKKKKKKKKKKKTDPHDA